MAFTSSNSSSNSSYSSSSISSSSKDFLTSFFNFSPISKALEVLFKVYSTYYNSTKGDLNNFKHSAIYSIMKDIYSALDN